MVIANYVGSLRDVIPILADVRVLAWMRYIFINHHVIVWSVCVFGACWNAGSLAQYSHVEGQTQRLYHGYLTYLFRNGLLLLWKNERSTGPHINQRAVSTALDIWVHVDIFPGFESF